MSKQSYLFVRSTLYRYQFISVLYRIPSVFSCQNCIYLISFQILQLLGESSARFRVGSFAPTFIFGIKDSFLVFLLAPVVPANGKNVFPQFATDEYSLCIRTPGTGQIHFCGFRFRSQFAIIEYIAIFFTFISRGSGDITIPFAMNVATVENSRRPTEDKIYRSFDVAVFIILAALLAVCIEGILEAEETTVLKIDTIGRYETGNCLSYGT